MSVLWLCGALLLSHLAADAFLSSQHAVLPSGILLLTSNLVAAIACFWRARISPGSASTLWALLGVAEFIHFLAGFEVGMEMVFFHLPHNAVTPSDFVIYLWGVPLLLAISSPAESKPSELFFWLDGLQITLLILSLFLVVFGAFPFQEVRTPAISALTDVIMFEVANLVILAAVALRLKTRLPNRDQRAFFTCAFLVLAVYSVMAPLYNIPNALLSRPPIRLQFVFSFHQILLILLAANPPVWPESDDRSTRDRNMGVLMDNIGSIVFPMGIVVACDAILHSHPRVAGTFMLVALAAYGLRSTVVQVRYQHIQAQMEEVQRDLEQTSLTDPLTQIGNRRFFDLRLNEAWQFSRNAGRPFSLLLIDLDHFKLLNDTFGHTEGDRCLFAVAQALAQVMQTDRRVLARIGGEEFAAILPRTDAQRAHAIATEMMQAVTALQLQHVPPTPGFVTVSIGIADSSRLESVDEMFQRADAALYRAKHEGRNRAVALPA